MTLHGDVEKSITLKLTMKWLLYPASGLSYRVEVIVGRFPEMFKVLSKRSKLGIVI